ncbi:MAG: hypothetical protein DMG07_15240 [Acidobacteria bacterium]|nr:MAG: hypothetical protein DMG07_15240 [Acidobacteriota bacterium]
MTSGGARCSNARAELARRRARQRPGASRRPRARAPPLRGKRSVSRFRIQAGRKRRSGGSTRLSWK